MGKPKYNYSQIAKDLKPYLNYKPNIKELSRQDKAKLRRIYKKFDEILRQPVQPTSSKSKKNIKILQKETGIRSKYVKAYPVPVSTKGTKIKFTKDGIIRKAKGVSQEYFEFDKENLLESPKDEINNIKNQTDAQYFRIKCGKFEIQQPYLRNEILGAVKMLMNKYSDDSANNPKKEKGHGWENWLDGLIADSYYDYRNYSKFNKEKQNLHKAETARRKAEKRKTKTPQQKKAEKAIKEKFTKKGW